MADDKVLIEIITAANMAGVEQANKGFLGLSGSAAAAGLVLGFGIGIVEHAVQSYLTLAESVEHYKQVVGGTAESASRMVEAFLALGVSEETAQTGMFKLSKAIETTPKKLEDLGVVIAHNAKGNVDLTQTLYNVADAYNATTDQAQKNLIVFDAFGRNGQTLIPILEQIATFKQKAADAPEIFTTKDLNNAREFQIQLRSTKMDLDAFVASIAKNGIPVVSTYLDNTSRLGMVQQELATKLHQGKISYGEYVQAYLSGISTTNTLVNSTLKDVDAKRAQKLATDAATEASQKGTEANKEAADALKTLYDAQEKEIDAQGSVEHAQINAEKAAIALTDAQDALTKAIQDYGPNSKEARDAELKLQEARLSQVDAAKASAKSEVELAAETALAGGTALDSQQKHDLYVQALGRLRDAAAPGSPLRTTLDGYIATLGGVPATVRTVAQFEAWQAEQNLNAFLQQLREAHAEAKDLGGSFGGGGQQHFAAGGRAHKGQGAWVGEEGPEFVTFGQDATVHPHGEGGGDMSEIADLLREISAKLDAPTGQTGVEAALYKATQLARSNRARGMQGA